MKVIISGYGRMGHMVEEVLRRRGIEIAAISEDLCSVNPGLARQSVCIDFTTPEAFRKNYPFLAENFKAVVVGTTGWQDIKDEVFEAFRSHGTTLVWASNFSLGVNALFAAVTKVSEILRGRGYTPHVEEIHHIHKLDSPSGTAVSIANLIEEHLGERPEIGAQRIGEVPGIHTAEFKSEVDKLTLTHEAFSRKGFAEGAVYAAELADTLEGIHEFKDLII